jgi:hypothetical protein
MEFVGSGRLAEAWGGHPAGEPFLVLRTRCSLERQRARDLLSDLAGVTELMWENGWGGLHLPDGSVVTDLRLFPGQTPSPVGSPS